MSSGSLSFPFEKLHGRENFDVWKQQAKSYLIIKGLWKTVESGVAENATESQKDTDCRASAEIYLMIDPSNYGIIAEKPTAKEAWDSLMEAYEDKGLTRKVELLKHLVQLKLNDFPNMQEYINAMVMTSIKIKTAGLDIGEEIVASLLLAGLPNEFKSLVLAIENSKKVLTVDSIKSLLLQDAKFDTQSSEENALYSGKNKNNNKPKKKYFLCHTCKQPGHFSKNCPTKTNKKDYSRSDNEVLLASLIANKETMPDWHVDSGASNHMTNNNESLLNEKPVAHKAITIADNNKMSVVSVGDLELSIANGNDEKYVTIKNVEYVPNLCTNLLSVSQMALNGKRVVFNKNYCNIIDNGTNRVVATASLVDGLYKLNCKHPKTISGNASVVVDYKLWHRRLGHIGNELVSATTQKNRSVNSKSADEAPCVICVKGKQTRTPFKESQTAAKSVLDIVHSDVMGPFQVASFSGSRYILTFVDDYSRKVFVIPIKSKSEVYQEFVKFKTFVENQCSKKIKVFRSDNGTEYVNNNFKNLFSKSGILHQTTSPYTPEQNGIAERMNRTLMERIRCMLLDANLDQKFWAEAANTAAYVLNRISRKRGEVSPEELWSGKCPSLSHLRVFGCKALVHIPKQKRNSKLTSKSLECIFVGYSCNAKAYRLFSMDTQKITVSRDVKFLENDQPIQPKADEPNMFSDIRHGKYDVDSEEENLAEES